MSAYHEPTLASVIIVQKLWSAWTEEQVRNYLKERLIQLNPCSAAEHLAACNLIVLEVQQVTLTECYITGSDSHKAMSEYYQKQFTRLSNLQMRWLQLYQTAQKEPEQAERIIRFEYVQKGTPLPAAGADQIEQVIGQRLNAMLHGAKSPLMQQLLIGEYCTSLPSSDVVLETGEIEHDCQSGKTEASI